MKTVIYNIGMLAGILPADVRKLEGEQMGHVECLHDAYLVIEDGVIYEFGEGRGLQDRATPLAAGGGVVLQIATNSTRKLHQLQLSDMYPGNSQQLLCCRI